jgi:SAM-dependent methyltransferase
MQLIRPTPPDRSAEQLWNHFQVEKRLADRLKAASREERKRIYESMYDELFRLVPDHPRLTRKQDPEQTRLTNELRLKLLGDWLKPDATVAEFAPGDCRFAATLAGRVRRVYGIDISDQRGAGVVSPSNFSLIVYDGYDTEAIADGSIDLAYSDQLIEHFHPEDLAGHLRLVHRLLKPGGEYVFRTPHALTGPHDVSMYFSDEPQGFHLKEWTFHELGDLLLELGYKRATGYWFAKGRKVGMPDAYFSLCERALRHVPKRRARPVAQYLLPEVVIAAEK